MSDITNVNDNVNDDPFKTFARDQITNDELDELIADGLQDLEAWVRQYEREAVTPAEDTCSEALKCALFTISHLAEKVNRVNQRLSECVQHPLIHVDADAGTIKAIEDAGGIVGDDPVKTLTSLLMLGGVVSHDAGTHVSESKIESEAPQTEFAPVSTPQVMDLMEALRDSIHRAEKGDTNGDAKP